jgi:hypothetical protein
VPPQAPVNPNKNDQWRSETIWLYTNYNRIIIHEMIIIEGSLEVKLPTVWTDEKQRWEESARRRKKIKKEKE